MTTVGNFFAIFIAAGIVVGADSLSFILPYPVPSLDFIDIVGIVESG